MMENNSKPALRLILYLPHAHWRVPFTYQRRHTLALPPYSTVIGLLCNLLGIRNLSGDGAPCRCECCTNIHNQESCSDSCSPEPNDSLYAVLYHELTHNLELAISGIFKSKTSEYTWFRNLNKDKHVNRFGDVENRMIDGIAEHPGGQSPVTIDILNDVYLVIYIAHKKNCKLFLDLLEHAFSSGGDFSELPKDFPGHCSDHQFCNALRDKWDELRQRRRLSPLHLGRAEDWFRIEDIKIVELEKNTFLANTNLFTWIPKDILPNNNVSVGLLYRVPTFYALRNRHRLFHYVESYLNDGDFGVADPDWNIFIDAQIQDIPEELHYHLHLKDLDDKTLPVFLTPLLTLLT